jgi:hypothetical protein
MTTPKNTVVKSIHGNATLTVAEVDPLTREYQRLMLKMTLMGLSFLTDPPMPEEQKGEYHRRIADALREHLEGVRHWDSLANLETQGEEDEGHNRS